MSKSDQFEYDFLRLVFNAVSSGAMVNLAATAGSTRVWMSLHTADPGDSGTTASEGIYSDYTRISRDRSSASTGWAVTSGAGAAAAGASPVSAISFPQHTSTSTGTFTHAGVWTSSNVGTTGFIYGGTISPTINFSQNVTPQLTTGSSITEQ